MSRVRGAEKFHLADITTNTEEEYIVGKPEKTERIIGIELDQKVDSETLYSDDETEEEAYGVVERTGKVTLNYLSTDTKIKLFGGTKDSNGVYFPTEEYKPNHMALLFRAPTNAEKTKFKYVCYYDVAFELPSFKAETMENKPKTQTVELSFKCYKNKKLNKPYYELDTNDTGIGATAEKTFFDTVITEITAATQS